MVLELEKSRKEFGFSETLGSKGNGESSWESFLAHIKIRIVYIDKETRNEVKITLQKRVSTVM